MSAEIITEKYRAIRETYGPEAESFAKKIIAFYAKGRGRDSFIWEAVLSSYKNGEIVPYSEELVLEDVRDKILLHHGIARSDGDFEVDSAFGYVDSNNTAIFAEIPSYDWDGTVTSIATSILDIGKSFHDQLIPEGIKHRAANNHLLMINALGIGNRLSLSIQRGIA